MSSTEVLSSGYGSIACSTKGISLTVKLITLLPIYTAFVRFGSKFMKLVLGIIKVPNFDKLSSIKNFPVHELYFSKA